MDQNFRKIYRKANILNKEWSFNLYPKSQFNKKTRVPILPVLFPTY